jgi:SsrA-binding protein
MTDESSSDRVVVTNRKAFHDYEILDRLEAGIALRGTEVKSLRSGGANLQDGYATIRNGEVWLIGMHISPFDKGNINNHDPKRDRKLLLHKKEIRKLLGKQNEKGLTIVPLRLYFKKNIIKVELGIARGKRTYDKRAAIAKREIERHLQREYSQ